CVAGPDVQLPHDRWRPGVVDENGRLTGTVGRHGPDVAARRGGTRARQPVQHMVVVQPLELVVDAVPLGEQSLGTGAQVVHRDAPLTWREVAVLLERDAGPVRRQRRALDVLPDRGQRPAAQTALYQPGLAA